MRLPSRTTASLLMLVSAPLLLSAAWVVQSDTRKLHMVRQQRTHDIHCREAAQRARSTARVLRETAQREPLDVPAVLRLRTELAEQVAGLAREHREFVESLTPEQAAQARETLAYVQTVHERVTVHLEAIGQTVQPARVAELRRHCRVLERDLKDWNDQHAAVSRALGLGPE